MSVSIQNLIQDCRSAIQHASRPVDFATIAGLSALIHRLDPRESFLEEAKEIVAAHKDVVANYISASLLPIFMDVDTSDDEEERQMGWYDLYLYISALNWMGVTDSHPVHSRVEQVVVGIDDGWESLRFFAQTMQHWYPIAVNDSTIDLVNATLGQIQPEEQVEAEIPNLFAMKKVQRPITVVEDGVDELINDEPIAVLNFSVQAAATKGNSFKTLCEFERSKLFAVYQGVQPVYLMLKGDLEATANVAGTPIESKKIGDALRWSFQTGDWTFIVEGASYTIEVKQ